MLERDERPLAEIRFSQDTRECMLNEDSVRSVFQQVGVQIAQDIIELGCTGLVHKLYGTDSGTVLGSAVNLAQGIRKSMAGSICGLPCYVPPDRFCLVHNIPGALQLHGNIDGPQLARHPEGIPLCSRELTAEELAVRGQIQRKIVDAAADEAKAMGGEVLPDAEIEAATERLEAATLQGRGPVVKALAFVCPEHTEFNPKCRFCLAQAVAEGPLEPVIEIRARGPKQEVWTPFTDGGELDSLLGNAAVSHINLFVLAARWVRKLTRE